MLAFLIRRILQALVVMLAVGLVAFAMFRFVGDPVGNMLGQEATLTDRAEASRRLGLDRPVAVQFVQFLGRVVTGDLGVSYRQARKVSTLIAERLPATLELALCSALLALVLGVALGLYTALDRTGLLSRAIMAVSLAGVALPTFLIGIALIYVFAVELRWLPSFGRGEVVQIGWWSTGLLTPSGRAALVLPVITLALYQTALIMRLVRAEMLEVLRSDFIRFARARGLTERTVTLGHALRNTLVPVITIAGLQLGGIIAFAIVSETVFQWPGLGLMFIDAVQFVDIPVISSYLLFVGLVFVSINLVVDLLYFFVDPSLRADRSSMA
jgi:peptide/nickel transport system permease protein